MASCNASLILITLAAALVSTSNSQETNQPLYLHHICNHTTNYTQNTTYQTNLNLLLNTLSPDGAATGYLTTTVGTGRDRVYGLILCRGDIKNKTCQTCMDVASVEILRQCPNQKTAYMWYNQCYVRYSDTPFFSLPVYEPMISFSNNTINKSHENADVFNEYLYQMMDQLALRAAYHSTKPFAVGEVNFSTEIPKLYGMVMCNEDLSSYDCYWCLRGVLNQLPECCADKLEGRVFSQVCIFWYNVYKFFNGPSQLISPPSPPPGMTTNSTGSGNKKNSSRKVLAVLIPVVIAFVLISVCCICFLKRKRKKKNNYNSDWQDIVTIESLFFDSSTIKDATDNFSQSNKLGEGGFGIVYKGIISNGREIAVKRLSTSSTQGINELKNEVVLLTRLQHRNLVRLLGVCLEEEEKLLVYEYVPNKSLDTFLFDPTNKQKLPWERRYTIIVGVARGLVYLHEESHVKIIHRDLKASNILLDADMNPKIADFGLAKLFDGDQNHLSTKRVVGTLGYMSPEYAIRGRFSNKSDVFSFGVLVLETVIGRKNSDFFNSEEATDLLSYVWVHWSSGSIMEAIDPSFKENCMHNEVLRCIHIGLLCVQEAPAHRPKMSAVILMLNNCAMTLEAPLQPAYHRSGAPKQLMRKLKPPSINEVTVTNLLPR